MSVVPSQLVISFDEETIKSNPSIFKYILNPGDEMIDKAIKINPSIIKYINNPSIEHCLKAFEIDNVLFHSMVKTPELCLNAVKKMDTFLHM